jgi:hypothetical protein
VQAVDVGDRGSQPRPTQEVQFKTCSGKTSGPPGSSTQHDDDDEDDDDDDEDDDDDDDDDDGDDRNKSFNYV